MNNKNKHLRFTVYREEVVKLILTNDELLQLDQMQETERIAFCHYKYWQRRFRLERAKRIRSVAASTAHASEANRILLTPTSADGAKAVTSDVNGAVPDVAVFKS